MTPASASTTTTPAGTMPASASSLAKTQRKVRRTFTSTARTLLLGPRTRVGNVPVSPTTRQPPWMSRRNQQLFGRPLWPNTMATRWLPVTNYLQLRAHLLSTQQRRKPMGFTARGCNRLLCVVLWKASGFEGRRLLMCVEKRDFRARHYCQTRRPSPKGS